jgi:hypothetical protein
MCRTQGMRGPFALFWVGLHTQGLAHRLPDKACLSRAEAHRSRVANAIGEADAKAPLRCEGRGITMQANPVQGHAASGRDTTDLTADSVQQFTRTW